MSGINTWGVGNQGVEGEENKPDRIRFFELFCLFFYFISFFFFIFFSVVDTFQSFRYSSHYFGQNFAFQIFYLYPSSSHFILYFPPFIFLSSFFFLISNIPSKRKKKLKNKFKGGVMREERRHVNRCWKTKMSVFWKKK